MASAIGEDRGRRRSTGPAVATPRKVRAVAAGGSTRGRIDNQIAVADDGTVFAADYANNRIEKWRPGP